MIKSLENIKSKVGFISAVFLAAVVGGLTTNLAQADVPDANGLITACYRTNGGDLNIIDTENSETCSNKETQLSWYQDSGVISGVGTSPLNGASSQLILTVPGFGEVKVDDCDESSITIKFVNNSGHDVVMQKPNGVDLVLNNTDEELLEPQLLTPLPLWYESAGTMHMTTLLSYVEEDTSEECTFHSQATISHTID